VGERIRAASRAGGTGIHILELTDAVTQVIRAQIKVSDKENEIPVARVALLKQAIDADTVVTADALHAQKATANVILKKTLITSW